MTTYDRCPVCSGTHFHEVMQVKDYTVSRKFFPVCHCSDCSFRFTQHIPNDQEIGAYYKSEDYISHTDTRKGLVSKLYHAVRGITLKGKRKMIGKLVRGKSGKILDYGCGTGAFLHEMKTAGWETTGLEPDPGARQMAVKLNGEQVFPPDYIRSLPENHFDIITLWHVLEHVHRLKYTLDHLNRVLKPGGFILIAVPNYTSADAQNYGPYWAAWDVPRHLYHFSPESMKKLLPEHGFKLTEIHPMWFDSFYVSMLSEKYRESGNQYLGALYQGLKSNLLAMRNNEECSSLIYVAVKS